MKILLTSIIVCAFTIVAQAQTPLGDSIKITIDNPVHHTDFAQYSLKENHPLFILDGMAFSKDSLSRINPDFIESIEVLKGPKAEVYGERGKNGVIIIKLKDPRNGRIKKDLKDLNH